MNKEKKVDEKITSGIHPSLWTATTQPRQYEKLSGDESCDVVIVGGGIAGVSIAYQLSKAGSKVILVEDGYLGSGETGRTTAHLVTALDDRYYELERIYGDENSRLIAESHRSAIDLVEQNCRTENIHCQFKRVDGYLFLHPSDEPSSLDKEFEAVSKAGLEAERLSAVPGIQGVRHGCIRFSNQAQFHPLFYLNGLADAAARYGAKIFTKTHAKEIDHTGIATDEGFKISAKHIVVATNTPVNNMYVMHLKQFPYRTYVIGALVKKGSVPKALWWDTGDMDGNENIPPYHYIRTEEFSNEYDVLISGGEDHATGLADADVVPEENRYALLEEWTRRHFPIGEVRFRWSGQVMEPMDGLAYIGKNPHDKNNVYIVTGDSGNGMTHGTIASMIIPDLINGKENKWEKIYNPSRLKIFKSGKKLFSEFSGGLKNYFKTYPGHADEEKINAMQPGEAKIIELSGKKYGAYYDAGKLHLVKAECTHLKCIVKWNGDEKSWDCPCHGSRFTFEGKVLNGPANVGLEYFQEDLVELHQHR